MADLVRKVADAIGYGVDVAGADIDTVARAAIRATLEAAVERVAPLGNRPKVRGGSYYEGAFDGRAYAADALRAMLAALDG